MALLCLAGQLFLFVHTNLPTILVFRGIFWNVDSIISISTGFPWWLGAIPCMSTHWTCRVTRCDTMHEYTLNVSSVLLQEAEHDELLARRRKRVNHCMCTYHSHLWMKRVLRPSRRNNALLVPCCHLIIRCMACDDYSFQILIRSTYSTEHNLVPASIVKSWNKIYCQMRV